MFGCRDDYIDGGEGNDFIDGAGAADVLIGGNGYDQIEGGSGGDELYGGAGSDDLAGGTGSDVLFGGYGVDYAYFAGARSGYSVDVEMLLSSTSMRPTARTEPTSSTRSNTSLREGGLIAL